MTEKIGIVGAGRLGSSFARALCEAGCSVVAVSDKIESRARACAAMCGVETAATSPENLPDDLTLLILAVADDDIPNVVEELAYTLSITPQTIVVHTSGALTADVLAPLKPKTRLLASMHPVQTFSGSSDDWQRLFGIYYGIEGYNRAVPRLRAVVTKLKSKVFLVPKKKKALYHLGCVFSSNILVAVHEAAIQIMEHTGITETEAVQILEPLVQASFENVQKSGTVKALTGPVSRGDLGTVKHHIRELEKYLPDLLPMYLTSSLKLLQIARRQNKVDPEKLNRIESLLKRKEKEWIATVE